jgi:hypothetical protein
VDRESGCGLTGLSGQDNQAGEQGNASSLHPRRAFLFLNSAIDQATISAYLETDYIVRGESSVILRIGKVSPELAEIHRSHRVDCSVFITAFNPLSQPLNEQENARRHEFLMQEIKLRSLPTVQGLGSHPDNGRPPEVSLLVPGLSLEASKSLGARFEQNAIVWSGTDAVPQLILLR